MFLILLPMILSTASVDAPATKHPDLGTVEVNDRQIVVRGSYLGRVEIWGVPRVPELP
jgi:hypothetical protein